MSHLLDARSVSPGDLDRVRELITRAEAALEKP